MVTFPPRRHLPGWTGPFAVLVASLAVFLGSQLRIESLFADRGAGYRLLYLPSGKYLKIASLGFSQVLADVIYLWSIQFYSEPMNPKRREYLEHIFGGVLAELDPHYLDPYLTGALTMANDGGDVRMALRLLEKGMENNPDSWLLPADAGFYAYLNLRDLELAREYFRRGMEVPGAPPVLARLYAGMIGKLGDDRGAHQAWLEIYEQAEDEYTRRIASRHLHDLKIDLDLEALRDAVRAHREEHGRWPESLGALVDSGRIDVQPLDPAGRPYRYDPRTGSVTSGTPYLLRREE